MVDHDPPDRAGTPVTQELPPDTEFDLRARAELALAFVAGEPPPTLWRATPPLWTRRSFQRGLLASLFAGGGTGAVYAVRPPELVRQAIEHEYHERTLRGTFMEPTRMLSQIGMGRARVLPGYPQLLRPCEISGLLAYHLTTFFEKGGMVTLLAFDQPVALDVDHGWWNHVYWSVVRSKDGKPIVMVSQRQRALAVAAAALATGAA